jgi:two-component system, OmpR family, KDP operon response regulator KdpE
MSETKRTTVLLIEDDAQIRRFLRVTLAHQGYRLLEAVTGQEGLRYATTQRPDLIILDLGLPDMDGLAIAREVRSTATTPIVILSARGQEGDKIAALDAGADDYVTKPFSVGELLARMRVALRHAAGTAAGTPDPVYQADDLLVDLVRRRVVVRGEEVHLTPIEYKLLALLVRHAGRVVTHRQLLREVWGPSFEDQTHYLRVYMQQLRRKVEHEPARPHYLRTEPGVGYRLVEGLDTSKSPEPG